MQRLPQPVDGRIQAVIEIDERAVWPQPQPQLVACDELARSFQQRNQQRQRLVGQALGGAVAEEVARARIQLEVSEAERTERGLDCLHDEPNCRTRL